MNPNPPIFIQILSKKFFFLYSAYHIKLDKNSLTFCILGFCGVVDDILHTGVLNVSVGVELGVGGDRVAEQLEVYTVKPHHSVVQATAQLRDQPLGHVMCFP